jgi:hypothetical protein
MVTKSIIESLELENKTVAYIQSAFNGGVALSFDSSSQQYMQHLTKKEAQKMILLLDKVLQELS